MDRQTTIKRLEEMEQWLLDKSYSDLRARDHYEIVGAAIDLLKAQEPIAPTRPEDTWKCGACGEGTVGWDDWLGLEEPRSNYCPHCGRKVLWE